MMRTAILCISLLLTAGLIACSEDKGESGIRNYTGSILPDSEVAEHQKLVSSNIYHAKEVTFASDAEDVRLAGTVTWPRGVPHFPAVILIQGGGAHDRNYSIGRHQPYQVIADYLTRHGIAVLRFDERGVGESTGNPRESTCENYAEDVRAGIRFLEIFGGFTPTGIGLLGHS